MDSRLWFIISRDIAERVRRREKMHTYLSRYYSYRIWLHAYAHMPSELGSFQRFALLDTHGWTPVIIRATIGSFCSHRVDTHP